MAKRFRPYSVEQDYLLPPSLDDWLPENHLARFLVEVTKEMDLSGLLRRYQNGDGRGLAAYNPVMLLRLVLYGYCMGKRSSRQIEKATYDEVAYRYLSGDQHPDHDTIGAFRQEHLKTLGELFVEGLRLCREAGMVKLGQVAIDGTKMRANADRNRTRRYQRIVEKEQELEREVERILGEAAQRDAEEDARYGKGQKPEDLPAALSTREKRLEKIREARQRLEKQAAERAELAEKERAANGGKHRDNAAKKRYQRATAGVEKSNPQYNFTDPDSKIMPNPAGGYLQGYNAQIAVDGAKQVIVAAEVSGEPVDCTQLAPMVRAAERELQKAGGGEQQPMGEGAALPAERQSEGSEQATRRDVIQQVVADAGYFNIDMLQDEALQGKQVLVSPDSRLAIKEQEPGKRKCMHELAQQMRAKLGTEEGRRQYAQRAAIVEPVFAWIKQVRGIRGFLVRGTAAVRGEWRLICLTQNLLKLRRFRGAQAAA
jgi:transposase